MDSSLKSISPRSFSFALSAAPYVKIAFVGGDGTVYPYTRTTWIPPSKRTGSKANPVVQAYIRKGHFVTVRPTNELHSRDVVVRRPLCDVVCHTCGKETSAAVEFGEKYTCMNCCTKPGAPLCNVYVVYSIPTENGYVGSEIMHSTIINHYADFCAFLKKHNIQKQHILVVNKSTKRQREGRLILDGDAENCIVIDRKKFGIKDAVIANSYIYFIANDYMSHLSALTVKQSAEFGFGLNVTDEGSIVEDSDEDCDGDCDDDDANDSDLERKYPLDKKGLPKFLSDLCHESGIDNPSDALRPRKRTHFYITVTAFDEDDPQVCSHATRLKLNDHDGDTTTSPNIFASVATKKGSHQPHSHSRPHPKK